MSDFNSLWGDRIQDISQFRPSPGFIHEGAQVVCTKSLRVCKYEKFSNKHSTVWAYVDDISAVTGKANTAVCLLDFEEVNLLNFPFI